jgi:hypothetical protein
MSDALPAPTFDFIAAKQFRESLESDYAEMHKCHAASAWKSVQVLSGSIVESLLVDYLLATQYPARVTKDPLKMDLGEAISICRSESAITDRTADLCSVIRSYRNLIHPGRMIRLKEPAPSPKSATIAVALVDMIAEELAAVRRATVGLTAEQILSKIERDGNIFTILKHLLLEVSENDRERLLVDLIPTAYFKIVESDEDAGDYVNRLVRAYPALFDSVGDEARRRVAAVFVKVIREEDGHRVEGYGSTFFRASYLQYIATPQLAMVREHLLGRVPSIHTMDSLALVSGIENFLTVKDVNRWLDPFIRTLLSRSSESLKESARDQLLVAAIALQPGINEGIDGRLDIWIRSYEDKVDVEHAEELQALKQQISDMRIPF